MGEIRGRRGVPWAGILFVLVALGVLTSGIRLLSGLDVPGWWVVLLFGGALVAIGGGVFVQGAGLFARPLLGALPELAGGTVALTFDDGPDPTVTPAVLDLLDARGHRATFFVIGRRAQAHPELLREAVRRGHLLGNHSLEHSATTTFRSPAKLAVELEETQRLLDATGNRGRWFRPPVGLLSPRVVEAAQRAGLTLVSWTVTARDGIATEPRRALGRVARCLSAGAIIVLHDGSLQAGRAPQVAQLLPSLLDELESRGLRSVTLDELFKISRG